jgi:hypothetical protein
MKSLRSTPAMTLGIADRIWTIGDLLDAALATQPIRRLRRPQIGGGDSG